MKNKHGFTLIEVSFVTVILGIFAAFSLINYQKSMAHNELEKAANNLYTELRGLRPLSFKYDGLVRAKFYTTTMQCSIWVDTSTLAGTRKYRFVTAHQIPAPIAIGRIDANLSQPYTDGWWTSFTPYPSIASGVQGEWKDSIKVVPDSRGEYSQGGVYLYNPRLKKDYYFIGINSGMQSIELKKWIGATNLWQTF
jgi:prepilin-type N-terminal cleavage/methylation domain-containing protein